MPPIDNAALPAGPLTVAAVQAEAVPGDVAGNVVTAARLLRRAAAAGATVAVFPELFLPAYHPPVLTRDALNTDLLADAAGHIDDPRLAPLRAAAGQHRVVAVVGAAVRHADGRRTCSSVVLNRSGVAVVGYDKQHLCGPEEKSLFTPGQRGATLVVNGWRLGLGICYDGCFPEHGRAAAADGAHAYLCPAGYVTGSQHRRDLYYAARALDNTMYVVLANLIGGKSPWRFNGGSAIYDPEGRPVHRAPDDGEAVVVARLEPEQLSAVRSTHSMLADRHTDQGAQRALLVC
ncbi:MAG TPA: carbon-nitrogen hydrolase family protein [Micromonosporaceae bacterium]|nr:carbon-nitrogen hydrolase family protein [Micromonosporaceae bacterium]